MTLNLAENTMSFDNESAKVNVLKINSGLAKIFIPLPFLRTFCLSECPHAIQVKKCF